MATIVVKNNGCAEVAYADSLGKILIKPGDATLEIPDASVKSFIEAMERRAPYVKIRVVIDEPTPKPKKRGSRPTKKRKPAKKTEAKEETEFNEKPEVEADLTGLGIKPSDDSGGEE